MDELEFERVSIFFEDGLVVTVTQERLNEMLDDIMTGRPNRLYQFLKNEQKAGNKDLNDALKNIERFSPANLADA